MAHLLWGKNMLTPMLKLCLVVSLSCDPGQQQIFEFDVKIFLSRSRCTTLYREAAEYKEHTLSLATCYCLHGACCFVGRAPSAASAWRS